MDRRGRGNPAGTRGHKGQALATIRDCLLSPCGSVSRNTINGTHWLSELAAVGTFLRRGLLGELLTHCSCDVQQGTYPHQLHTKASLPTVTLLLSFLVYQVVGWFIGCIDFIKANCCLTVDYRPVTKVLLGDSQAQTR